MRGREDARTLTVLFARPTIPESWISRVLKKKKKKTKPGSSGRKDNKSDPYEGISDFSEVAAVFDYYEVCYQINVHTVGTFEYSYCCRRNGRGSDRAE